MSKHTTVKKKFLANSERPSALRTLPYDKGFHFYTAMGNYTGETATNLVNFAAKLEVIGVKSVNFHFKRSDFQKWIRDIVGDVKLAEKIDHIELELTGEKLRKELLGTLQAHISELKIAFSHQIRKHEE
jgi:hypothetical protein